MSQQEKCHVCQMALFWIEEHLIKKICLLDIIVLYLKEVEIQIPRIFLAL